MERKKILDLLAAGKITPEQAEQLIAAIETKTRPSIKVLDKPLFNELKGLGTQISSAVSQSLTDAKRAIEQQVEYFQLGNSTVAVSHDLALPLEIQELSAETTNGRIQVTEWDEPYVKVHVRAQVRTAHLVDGRHALEKAIQTHHADHRYDVTVINGFKDPDTGAQITGAHIDLQVPKSLRKVLLRSQNGRIHAEHVTLSELSLETTNGGIALFQVSAERLQLETENGGIELISSLAEDTSHVYAETKNGPLVIEGLKPSVRYLGTAHTTHGIIEVTNSSVHADYEEGNRPTMARLWSHPNAEASDMPTTRLELTTKNGSIRIR